jgi:hypothetical protein
LSRFRLILGVLAAASMALPALANAQGASSATQESNNPINDQGSNFDYRSFITAITPHVRGLELQVLEFADRLQLTNHTGKTVTIYGYEGEPYARLLSSGAVEVNTHSPAYYLNQSFYGAVNVPASASPQARPHWIVVDRTGQFEWHDHRIHWMSPVPPSKVTDKSKRTKIFNWRVPIRVGAKPANVDGELFWVPENSKTPMIAILALALIVLLSLAFVLWVRKRRAANQSTTDQDGDSAQHTREAW